jgi:hypothetical protein
LRERRTGRGGEFSYLVLQYAPRLFACLVALADRSRHEQIRRELSRLRADLTRAELERILSGLYASRPRGISDLLPQERRHIATTMAEERVAAMRVHARAVFDECQELLRDFAEVGLELPEELRIPCELSMQADVDAAAAALLPPFDAEATRRMQETLQLSRELGLQVHLESVAARFSRHLQEQTRALLEKPESAGFAAASQLLDLADTFGLQLERTLPEEQVHALVERLLASLAAPGMDVPPSGLLDEALALAERLNFAVDELRWRLQVPGGGPLPAAP